MLEEILGLLRHALTSLLDALPGAREWTLEVITSERTVTVDAHRRPSRITVRSLARARRDDVDRAVVRYFGASGCAIDRVRVVPVRNPDALPSRVHDYFRADLYVDRHRLSEPLLNVHHAVHVTTSDMSSGVIGISWEWPD